MSKKMLLTFIALLCLSLLSSLVAQTYTISGKVIDGETGEAIPFGNVYPKSNPQGGTTTDFDGYYTLKNISKGDSIIVSYIGYDTRTKIPDFSKLENGVIMLNFQLLSASKSLDEIVVVAGEDPAYPIMRKVQDQKKYNDTKKLEAYEYESYVKIELDIDNISEKFGNRKIIQKVQNAIDSLGGLTGEDGKPLIPIFLSESISQFYYRNNPERITEKVIKTKIEGVGLDQDSPVSQLLGSSFQQYNFYNNWMQVLEKDFVSPLAENKLLIGASYNELINTYLAMNQYEKALQKAKQFYELSLSTKAKQQILTACDALANIYSKLNDYQMAFEFQKQAKAYNDTIHSQKNAQNIQVIELERKEAENELLLKEKNLQRIDIENQKRALDVQYLIIFSILLILVLLGTWLNFIRKGYLAEQRNNTLLQIQNQKIERYSGALKETNQELLATQQEIRLLNQSLEQKVKDRTQTLEEANEKLKNYAFSNSHTVRRPLANILGLIEVIHITGLQHPDTQKYIDLLQKSAEKLDTIIHEINHNLENFED